MLESITLENYRAFRDSQEFSFTATTEKARTGYEYMDWVASSNSKRLLKTIFLFGNNGTGKSTFLDALFTLKMLAVRPANSKSNTFDPLPDTAFKFDSVSNQKPSTIKAVIHIDDYRYIYTIAWNKKNILLENLSRQTGRKIEVQIFKRTYNEDKDLVEIDFSEKCEISEDTQKLIRDNVIRNSSVISVYDNKNFDAPDIRRIYNYFINSKQYSRLNDDFLNLCELISKRDDEPKLHTILIKLLKDLGSNIVDYRVNTTKRRLSEMEVDFYKKQLPEERFNEIFPNCEETTQYLQFAHKSNDSDDYCWLEEPEESMGTINMLKLMIILYDTSCKSSFTIIDECAMGIHQENFNRIIQFFLAISNNTQVFLATQALPILNMDGYRRDTARFFNKDFDTGVSHCECIDLRKFHANMNIYKNYIDHSFGGKPTYPDQEKWEDELKEFKDLINLQV